MREMTRRHPLGDMEAFQLHSLFSTVTRADLQRLEEVHYPRQHLQPHCGGFWVCRGGLLEELVHGGLHVLQLAHCLQPPRSNDY